MRPGAGRCGRAARSFPAGPLADALGRRARAGPVPSSYPGRERSASMPRCAAFSRSARSKSRVTARSWRGQKPTAGGRPRSAEELRIDGNAWTACRAFGVDYHLDEWGRRVLAHDLRRFTSPAAASGTMNRPRRHPLYANAGRGCPRRRAAHCGLGGPRPARRRTTAARPTTSPGWSGRSPRRCARWTSAAADEHRSGDISDANDRGDTAVRLPVTSTPPGDEDEAAGAVGVADLVDDQAG